MLTSVPAVRSRIRPLFVTLKENPTTKKMVEVPKQPFKFLYDVCTVVITALITTVNGGSFMVRTRVTAGASACLND